MRFNKSTFKKGEWNAVCQRCGWKFKSSQLYKEWTGLMVCKINDCYEDRHPQDFLRAVPDKQSVPWTSPEPEDNEI